MKGGDSHIATQGLRGGWRFSPEMVPWVRGYATGGAGTESDSGSLLLWCLPSLSPPPPSFPLLPVASEAMAFG